MKNIRSKDEIELHNSIILRTQIEYPNLSELEKEFLNKAIWNFMCGFRPEKDPVLLLKMSMTYVQVIINNKLYLTHSSINRNELKHLLN